MRTLIAFALLGPLIACTETPHQQPTWTLTRADFIKHGECVATYPEKSFWRFWQRGDPPYALETEVQLDVANQCDEPLLVKMDIAHWSEDDEDSITQSTKNAVHDDVQHLLIETKQIQQPLPAP